MFTGIITHLGTLSKRKESRFTFVAPQELLRDIKIGSSVAVNGVCLTVVSKNKDNFNIEVMPETMRKTMLDDLIIGTQVNLELSMKAHDRFEGHIVQGHVDGVGTITSIIPEGNSHIFRFAVSRQIAQTIVTKGSIAVNGISLTVIEAESDWFTVGIIPYTMSHTVLGRAKKGDRVNIETDILVKYMHKLLRKAEKEVV